MSRLLGVFVMLAAAVALLSPDAMAAVSPSSCAETPEAAVLQALGNRLPTGAQPGGYRVRDIVVDPLLHRAFVHVEQCGHPERPSILLPFVAASSMEADPSPVKATAAAAPTRPAQNLARSGSVVAVAMGDTRVRSTVTGRLLHDAPLGGMVEVELASLAGAEAPGEPLRHVRGVLTAPDRVEVQQ